MIFYLSLVIRRGADGRQTNRSNRALEIIFPANFYRNGPGKLVGATPKRWPPQSASSADTVTVAV